MHCMKARVSICHDQIKAKNRTIQETLKELTPLVSADNLMALKHFLKRRAQAVRNSIDARHIKKLGNLHNEFNPSPNHVDKNNWVVNLFKKPLTVAERTLLEKGPKFAPTPKQIPHKNIVAEVEAAINHLPEESKVLIRNSTATILHKARPPSHKNLSADEKKTLQDLKKDETRILMKAEKGNCFVVLDKCDYDSKMDSLLSDRNTYELVPKPPFKRIEREINQPSVDQSNITNKGILLDPSFRPSAQLFTILLSSLQTPCHLYKTVMVSVPKSAKLAEKISNVDIQDDEVMLSFDVVSLFTAIPVDKACDYISNKLLNDNTLSSRTSLDSNEIISLLHFVLSNNYFIYDDKIYKQIHGCAMGSPVSPVVANLCMEAID